MRTAALQRRRSQIAALAVVLVVISLTPACSTDDERGGVEKVEWSSLGEIAYVLPDELPDGWALSHATERLGRPFEEWDDHVEVLSTTERDRFLIISAHRGAGSSDGTPAEVHAMDPEQFGYLFAYTVGSFPENAAAAGTSWQENGFELVVAEVGPKPDNELIQSVADKLRSLDDIDFDVPTLPEGSGYEPVASSPALDDVTDYTIVWRPHDLAGGDRREATSSPDEGPTLFVNVGSRFYAQADAASGTPTDPADAEVTREGDLLHLEYLLNGSPISVSGREVDEDELRDFARSLRAHDREEWVRRTGERLLVDEPDE